MNRMDPLLFSLHSKTYGLVIRHAKTTVLDQNHAFLLSEQTAFRTDELFRLGRTAIEWRVGGKGDTTDTISEAVYLSARY
ncbi:hypothetical protein GWI33_002240 [Rhynchophorus ferrugineus]|uniref:Uncharacterized protein n=1 Tax=Rhynchophorus ferrugineus TaxID=354439 RepID=A0A834MJP4_RHYFE|nr:hypothetical protein GWI33_002240 [Rhynchophorus ferrugineus]